MKTRAREALICAALGAALAVAALWAMSHVLRTREPGAELARATREALRLAREARQDAEDARRVSSALRVLSLVAGVSVPLVVAYLIFRLSARAEPGAAEILAVLEKEGLLEPPAGSGLSSGRRPPMLKGGTETPPDDVPSS